MFKILFSFSERDHPARVLGNGFVAEHDGSPRVAAGPRGQRHEHVEGRQRGPLVL